MLWVVLHRIWKRFKCIHCLLVELHICHWNCSIEDVLHLGQCWCYSLNRFTGWSRSFSTLTPDCHGYCTRMLVRFSLLVCNVIAPPVRSSVLWTSLPFQILLSVNLCKVLEVFTRLAKTNVQSKAAYFHHLAELVLTRKDYFCRVEGMDDRVWQRYKQKWMGPSFNTVHP